VDYKVQRCDGVSCSNFADLVTLPANATAYSDLTPIASQDYTYRGFAERAAGNSGTQEAGATTNFPADPSGVTATTISATQIDLAWSDNTTIETGYEVERCAGVGCSNFTPLVSLGVNAVGYSDNTVTLGESYTFHV